MKAQLTALVGVVMTIAGAAAARDVPGFPVTLGEGTNRSSPAVADLDGDGTLEIVVGHGEMLHVLTAGGTPRPGFPVKLGNLDADAKKHHASSPAICDLDGGRRKVIVAGGPDDQLYVVEPDGSTRTGFPIKVGAQIEAAPLCADVDRDGKKDIVVAVPEREVVGFDGNGRPLPGFPLKGVVPAESAIAAGDLEPGGPLELLVGGDDGQLYLFDGKGKVDVERRARTNYKISGGPSLGDVDGDGRFDIVFGSQDFNLYAVDAATWERRAGFPVVTGYRIYGSPALGDLNGDGKNDIVVGSADGLVYATDAFGKPLLGWPSKVDGKVVGSPAIGDLDLDGKPEVVAVSTTGKTYVFGIDGRSVRGTPFATPGENFTSPAIANLDGKEGPEVVVVSAKGKVYAFNLRPNGKLAAARIPWSTYAHDAERVARMHPNAAVFKDLRIEPSPARTTDALEVAYTYLDLDGEEAPGTRIAWFVNGKRAADLDNARTVPAGRTKKGESWTVRVQERDDFALLGEGAGARFTTSPALVVENTPPGAPGLAAVAATVRAGDSPTVRVAKESADADGDAIKYRTVWTVDEVAVALDKRALALPPKKALGGQRVQVTVIPEDGQSDGEPATLAWLVENTPPTPPEVALAPAAITRATGAKLVIKKPGIDIDGAAVRHEVTWTLDGKVIPLLPTALDVPGGVLVRGATLRATVVAHDGLAPSTAVVAEIKVGNTPPGAPVVALIPSAPVGGDALGAVVTTRAADADGDTPSYHVKWTLDGAPVADLDDVFLVPGARTKKGQRWRATVTADDGAARGKDVVVETVIGNRPPVAPVVALSPRRPRADEAVKLDVVTAARDPDGDTVKNQLAWFVDDRPVPASLVDAQGLKAGAAKKGQLVRVQVTPHDGQDAGPSSGDTIQIADRAPSSPRIALEPAKPLTTQKVRVSVTSAGVDPDGDKVTHVHHFFVNGARVDLPDGATELPARAFRAGDKIEVVVWATADGAWSEPVRADVTAVPTPPPAPTIAIEPREPLPGEPLRVQVTAQAPDDDGAVLRYEAKWTTGGRAVDGGLGGIAAGTTKKGQVYRVEVVAVDDDGRSTPTTLEVRVGNQPPLAPRIKLSAEQVTTVDSVSFEVTRPAADDDGDKVSLDIVWRRNGADVVELAGKTTVPSSATKKGDRFEVEVNANDGTAKSPGVRAEFSVVDTPPTPPRVAFSPAQPVAGEDLTVTIQTPGADVDGDVVTHKVAWFLDGKPVKQKPDQMVLPGKLLKAKAEVAAVVTSVADKAESAPSRVWAEVQAARPDGPAVSVVPAKPLPGDTLFAVVTPPERRELPSVIEVRWNVNGKASGITGPIVPGERVKRGETWQAVAVAIAEKKQSTPVTADVKVGNRPPRGPVIALSSRRVKATEAVRLSIVKDASDPDGDPVSLDIKWQKNGKRVASLDGAREVPPKETAKGDTFVVVVEAKDGSESAPLVTDAFVVEDTAPPGAKVVLEPARPKAGESVTARITPDGPDVDGDKVSFRVRFLVNGVPVKGHDGKATTLAASAFRRGDQVTVEVEPYDGELAGPVARADALSENGPPTLVGVAVKPASPTPGEKLSCEPTKAPADPDGDPLTTIVSWEVDGRAVGAAGPSSTLEAGLVAPGQSVVCRAFVTDGLLASAPVASGAVEVKSRAPSGIEVAMEPAAPRTGDIVRCGVTGVPVDPDGEPLAVEVSALVNGKPVGGASTKVEKGQTVECRGVVKDARMAGAEVSKKAVVGNARPEAGKPALNTTWPRAGVDDLVCTVASPAKDPEGDKLLYRVEWTRNGGPAGLPPNQTKIAAKALVAGDVWVCRLVAQDGEGDGVAAASASALVRKDPDNGNPTRRLTTSPGTRPPVASSSR